MDRALDDRELCALGPDPAGVDRCSAGDVALWHLHLVHGPTNISDGDRRF
jgi:hypothetical protein